nr:hypothetical protein [Tanacetum cinerariifolium]
LEYLERFWIFFQELKVKNSLSKITGKRLPHTRGSSEGTGRIPGVPDESTIVSATSEMTNAEVEDSGKGDSEIFDVAKADAEKIEEIKDDAEKAKLPTTSSSLSVSSVISKPSILTSIPKTPLVAPAITLLPPPSISTIPPILLQTTTTIPTPPIITDAPTITTVVLESNALTNVQISVAKLEKELSKLKKIDHFAKALATLKSQFQRFLDNILDLKSVMIFKRFYRDTLRILFKNTL